MPADTRRPHIVVRDHPDLLDALARPFGTYRGVATCRVAPGARKIGDIIVDLLVAVGKTEALTVRRVTLGLVETWMSAYRLQRLFVTGVDGVAGRLRQELCGLGDRLDCTVVFVVCDPDRHIRDMVDVDLRRDHCTVLTRDPDHVQVPPPVGAVLPDVGFPGLPAACTEFLAADHAARAQEIYDCCLASAFAALRFDRALDALDAETAFAAALSRTPDRAALALATNATRAAGLLRGYHIAFKDCISGVAVDKLLTADRLAQLGRLVSPHEAAYGIREGTIGSSWQYWQGDDYGEGIGHWSPLLAERCAATVVPAAAALLRPDTNSDRPSLSGRVKPHPQPPHDQRDASLWRTPPGGYMRATCEPIDCNMFRRIGEPPMRWQRGARPRRKPRARR